MQAVRKARIFQAESFNTIKDWVYFCMEFDLEICSGCQSRARKRVRGAEQNGYRPTWHCDRCAPAMHPDLWRVIATRENTQTKCDLCGKITEVKNCWISDDCQRLYCATHLKPIRVEDRYRMARQYLQRWFGPRSRLHKDRVERLSRMARELRSAGLHPVTARGEPGPSDRASLPSRAVRPPKSPTLGES